MRGKEEMWYSSEREGRRSMVFQNEGGNEGVWYSSETEGGDSWHLERERERAPPSIV